MFVSIVCWSVIMSSPETRPLSALKVVAASVFCVAICVVHAAGAYTLGFQLAFFAYGQRAVCLNVSVCDACRSVGLECVD